MGCCVARKDMGKHTLNRHKVHAQKEEKIEAKFREGDLFLFGDNSRGQIGDESKIGRFDTPLKSGFGWARHPIRKFSVGYDHVCVTTSEGELFGWGSNSNSQLGSRSSSTIDRPCKLKPGMYVKDVACGHGFTLVIDKFGKVFGVGANSRGQLGNGKAQDRTSEFVRVCGIEKAYKVCAGKAHTVVLQETEHSMYVFGDNSSNQLGISSDDDMLVQAVRVDNLSPWDVACGDTFTVIVSSERNVKIAGTIGSKSFPDKFKSIDEKKDCKNVSAGSLHVLVLTMKGIVRVWGQGWAACCEKNTDQKLDETEPVMELRSEKVVQVAAGSNHSMALTDRGLLFTWGSGKMGELGLGIDVDGKYLPCLVDNIKTKDDAGIMTERSPFFHAIAAGGNNSLVMSDHNVNLDDASTKDAFASRKHFLRRAETLETRERRGRLDEISKEMEKHAGHDEAIPEPDSKNMTDEEIRRRMTFASHDADVSRNLSVVSLGGFEVDEGITPPPPPPRPPGLI